MSTLLSDLKSQEKAVEAVIVKMTDSIEQGAGKVGLTRSGKVVNKVRLALQNLQEARRLIEPCPSCGQPPYEGRCGCYM